jgi:hypothetical protein
LGRIWSICNIDVSTSHNINKYTTTYQQVQRLGFGDSRFHGVGHRFPLDPR